MEFDYSIVNGDVKFNTFNRVRTPFGEAEWAHLVTPDTKFNPDGDFKVNIILRGDEAVAIRSMIDEAHEDAFKLFSDAAEAATKPGRRARAVKKSEILPYEEVEDGIVLKLKRKACYTKDTGERIDFEVPIYNSLGKKISDEDKAELKIGNGSELRAHFEIVPYNMATSGVGISLRLRDVQIRKLVEYASASPYESVDDEYAEQGESEEDAYGV